MTDPYDDDDEEAAEERRRSFKPRKLAEIRLPTNEH